MRADPGSGGARRSFRRRFGALLSTLLAGAAAAETIPIAILAAVTGWLVALALQPPPDLTELEHDLPQGAA